MPLLLLKVPRNNQPNKMPADKIKIISNAPDIDNVQKRNLKSMTEVFWTINKTASPARIAPIMSLAFMAILLCPASREFKVKV